MRKVIYSMLIAFGLSACVESNVESPSKSFPSAEALTAVETLTTKHVKSLL
jgi:hypothetical protein